MKKVSTIEIVFDQPIEVPEVFESVMDALIRNICKEYEKLNPTRIMWPSGGGCKPIWNEPHEPTWDESVLQISVSEREDYHGRNRANPDGERLRAEAEAAREKRREGE